MTNFSEDPTCSQCEGAIPSVFDETYCEGCGGSFHKGCLSKHLAVADCMKEMVD